MIEAFHKRWILFLCLLGGVFMPPVFFVPCCLLLVFSRPTVNAIPPRLQNSPARVFFQENTPAYEVLQHHNLLTTSYRKTNFEDLFDENDLVASSSHGKNFLKRLVWGYYCGIGCVPYHCTHTETFVNAGEVGLFCDNENNVGVG